jgi:hypothetical protein
MKFLTAVLCGSEWLISRPDRFITKKRAPRHPLNKCLDQHRVGLVAERKREIFCTCPKIDALFLGHPVSSLVTILRELIECRRVPSLPIEYRM